MIGSLIGAFVRLTQLQKLAQNAKVQAYYATAKAWYKAQPRKIQLAVAAGVVVALGVAFFA
jgi:hypothetical protein